MSRRFCLSGQSDMVPINKENRQCVMDAVVVNRDRDQRGRDYSEWSSRFRQELQGPLLDQMGGWGVLLKRAIDKYVLYEFER